MRSVRAALQLVPTSLKQKLKRNESLTRLYVKSVREAGLFFDAPTAKETQMLYDQWLKLNQAKFVEDNSSNKAWQAVIFGSENVDKTIKSLSKAGASKYYCFTTDGKHFGQIVKDIDRSLPVLFLHAGDLVETSLASHFLTALQNTDVDAVYSDTDELSPSGKRINPRFLPDWNPDLHFSTAYLRSGVMVKASLLLQIELEHMQSVADLICRFAIKLPELKMGHIPLPLVHILRREECVSDLKAIKNNIERSKKARVTLNESRKMNSVAWNNSNPLVSLIIPTKNGKELVKACIDSVLAKTTYENYEIILIDNNSDDAESIAYFDELTCLSKITVLKYPKPFNYSAINNFGVRHAKGSIIGLINNDVEVIEPDWLTYMVGYVEREDVGCVGAKLLYSDTRIQHAGVVLGYGGGAGHAHKNFPRHHEGYLNRIIASSNYSAVTAACMLVKKSHFLAVNGLNERDLAVAFNDVDFCLKVKGIGVNNVYCAEAELFHHESVSRGLDISTEKAARFNKELLYLQNTWAHIIKKDPAYSSNLTLRRENFSIKTKEELLIQDD